MNSLKSPPAVTGSSIFTGCLHDYEKDPLGFLKSSWLEYGDAYTADMRFFKMVVLNHPDLIHEVLVAKDKLFLQDVAVRSMKLFLGNSMLVSDGETWRKQRKLAGPAFSMQRLEIYSRTMVDYVEKALDYWHNDMQIELSSQMAALTLGIALKTLFDVDAGPRMTTIAKYLNDAVHLLQEKMHKPLLFLLPEWVPLAINTRMRHATKELNKIIYSMIAEHKSDAKDHGDLMSMLLAAHDNEEGISFTDKQVRDETATFFVAGHETTAILLTWIFYLLSRNPHVENKLLEEFDLVLGKRLPTIQDLPNLKYTEEVIKEVLRLYPPAWAMGRQAKEDCTVGEWSITKGSDIVISQWLMHRNPQYFDEPDVFNPSRWDHDFIEKIPHFAYFPFGGGPRRCIGAQFATIEAMLTLPCVLRKYHMDFMKVGDIHPMPAFTLRPLEPMTMKLKSR